MIKVSLTLLISKLTRSTFINRVRFLSPRLWLTTCQTSLDWSPPPPPPRTYTPPPGTFSGLYVLVLCLLVYAILSRDLHDYSSQLWILRCNMPSHSHYPLRRKTWLTSFRHSNKIFNKNYTVQVSGYKEEEWKCRIKIFFTKNNNHPTCLYDYLLIHELKFNAARSNVVDLVNFLVRFQVFFCNA